VKKFYAAFEHLLATVDLSDIEATVQKG